MADDTITSKELREAGKLDDWGDYVIPTDGDASEVRGMCMKAARTIDALEAERDDWRNTAHDLREERNEYMRAAGETRGERDKLRDTIDEMRESMLARGIPNDEIVLLANEVIGEDNR